MLNLKKTSEDGWGRCRFSLNQGYNDAITFSLQNICQRPDTLSFRTILEIESPIKRKLSRPSANFK